MKMMASLRWLALLAVTVAACSDEPTVPPMPAPQVQADYDGGFFNDDYWGRTPDLRYIARFKSTPAPPDPLNDHAMIGPDGGSLRVGDFEIIVPRGAVTRPTLFRIRVPVDPREAIHAFAEFAPHQRFNRPLTVRLPATATNAYGTPYVLWWSGYFWLPLRTVPTADGRIEAQTYHFSIYGTSIWGKGITTLGG